MRKNRKIISFLSLLTIFLVLGGCTSSRHLEPSSYLLDLKLVQPIKLPKKYWGKIAIDADTSLTSYRGSNFLYRVGKGSGQYLIDYYNVFLVDPTTQLETALKNHLKSNSQSTKTIEGYKLQFAILELYVDYRCRAKPQAVSSIRFILTSTGQADFGKVIFDEIYVSKVLLTKNNHGTIVNAFSDGLKNILEQALGKIGAKFSYRK